MGKGFGELYKMRNIITYRLSPYELKAFAGFISHGAPNMLRRIVEELPFFFPFATGYALFKWAEAKHAELGRKNPKDFENEGQEEC